MKTKISRFSVTNMRISIIFALIIVPAILQVSGEMEDEVHKARYDNYGLYRFHLTSQEHVALFQELEEKSDSYTFYGHALNPDQNVSVVVASSKIAEIDELCQRFNIKYSILVSRKVNFDYITKTNFTIAILLRAEIR